MRTKNAVNSWHSMRIVEMTFSRELCREIGHGAKFEDDDSLITATKEYPSRAGPEFCRPGIQAQFLDDFLKVVSTYCIIVKIQNKNIICINAVLYFWSELCTSFLPAYNRKQQYIQRKSSPSGSYQAVQRACH
jgi:hypothetical protein